VRAALGSWQLVFFVEYMNQHRSVACLDWIGIIAQVVLRAWSQSLTHVDKVAKSTVCPIYIIAAVLEGASGARPGK